MALSYGFYNSYNGDRKYVTEQISAMFDGLINDGVFDSIGEVFATVPGDGMQVIVKSGKSWFNHTWLVNDAWYPLNLANPDVTRTRIDAIVIEVDHGQESRKTSIKVIEGLPSAVPAKPSMIETELVHQHPIAYVTINSGAMNLNVTDIEIVVGKSECPFVTGILESVAIDDLFNDWAQQFQAFVNAKEENYQDFLIASQESLNEWLAGAKVELDQWISDRQTEYDDWWNYIKDTLDPDVGSIVQLASDVASLRHDLTTETNNRTTSDATLQSNIESAQSTLQSNINTKQNKITVPGVLKGDGLGGVVSAVRGTDYDTPGSSKWCVQIITESQDITIRSDILNPAHIMAVGGGGSGTVVNYTNLNNGYCSNRASAGGGAGFFVETDVNLVPGKTYTVTIGAGGVLKNLTNEADNLIKSDLLIKYNNTSYPYGEYTRNYAFSGVDGGDTTFGSLVTAKGGKGAKFEILGYETAVESSKSYNVFFGKATGGDGSVGGSAYYGPPGNSASFGGSSPHSLWHMPNYDGKTTISELLKKYFGGVVYNGGNGGFYGGGAYPNGVGGAYGGSADTPIYEENTLYGLGTLSKTSENNAQMMPIDFFDYLLFQKFDINLNYKTKYDYPSRATYCAAGHGYSSAGGYISLGSEYGSTGSGRYYLYKSVSGGGKYGTGSSQNGSNTTTAKTGGGYIINGKDSDALLGGTAFITNQINGISSQSYGEGGNPIYEYVSAGYKSGENTFSNASGKPGILILFYRIK